MKISQWIVVVVGPLAAGAQTIRADTAAAALAGAVTPGAQGQQADGPASRVEEATARHVAVLTTLLEGAADRVHADLRRALAGAQRGRDAAHAALESSGDTRRLVRARREVSAAFRRSIATVGRLAARMTEGSSALLGNALVQIRQQRDVALENLDRLLPESSGGGTGADLSERRNHPARPDHRVQPVGSSCHPHAPSSHP